MTPFHDPLAVIVIPAGIPYFKRPPRSEESTRNHNETDRNKEGDSTKSEGSSQQFDESSLFFPPHESSPLTNTSSSGSARKLAGTVTLTHVPSLPLSSPPRHPLDKPSDSASDATETAGDSEPKLHGLSTINPGLTERDSALPISGWALDVPLDDEDLIYENPPIAGAVDHAMQVDELHRVGTSSGKGKEKEEISPMAKEGADPPIKVRLLTAAMGMCGKIIVVLGTRGRIWVYRTNDIMS
jgi:polycomb protein EED